MVKAINITFCLFYSISTFGQNLDSLDILKKNIYQRYNLLKKESLNTNAILVPNVEGAKSNKSFEIVKEKDVTYLQHLQKSYALAQASLYGNDDRVDLPSSNGIYNVSKPQLTNLSKIICAIIPKENLTPSPDNKTFTISGGRFKDFKPKDCKQNLCSNISFGNQLNPVIATGIIINNTRILTANHAVQDNKISEYYIVLGFVSNTSLIDASNVFEIQSVVPKNESDKRKDFKILKINKSFTNSISSIFPIDNNAISVFNRKDNISDKSEIFMIGFPSGLPMIVAGNAKVYQKNETVFFSNLDAFSGNSGSPVFNSQGQVEGILIDGAKDYTTQNDECCTIKSYSDDIENASEKEIVLRIQFIFKEKKYLID